MAAYLDRDVAPVGIEDVERVMIHIWHRLLSFEPMLLGTDVPHWSLCTCDQDQEDSLLDRCLVQMFFGNVVFALARAAVPPAECQRSLPKLAGVG